MGLLSHFLLAGPVTCVAPGQSCRVRQAEHEDLARPSEVSEEHDRLQHHAAGDFLAVVSDSD